MKSNRKGFRMWTSSMTNDFELNDQGLFDPKVDCTSVSAIH